MQIITLADPATPDASDRAREHLSKIGRRSRRTRSRHPESSANQPVEEADFVSEFGREAFMAAIEKIREYIVAGDVMQVVLAQRMSVPFGTAPINLYRALRNLNPSPYMYLHGPRRLPLREFVAGDPRPRGRRRHRQPPAGRNAAPRPHRSRRPGDGGRNRSATRRRSPST